MSRSTRPRAASGRARRSTAGALCYAWRSRIAALCLGLAAAAGSEPVAAQCALDVKTEPGSTSYRQRDYGCEGIYVGLQSMPLNVQVVSLLRGPLTFTPNDPALQIRTSPGSGPDEHALSSRTQVIGRALEANLNWALDGFAKAYEPMQWNLNEVFHDLELTSDRIGLAGRRERSSGLGGPVFVPVAVDPAFADPLLEVPLELVVRIPTASAARWSMPPGANWIDAESLSAADGYFRIILPPGPPGEITVLVRWRTRGMPGEGEPERLSIYRW